MQENSNGVSFPIEDLEKKNGTHLNVNTANEMECMVAGCKKKTVYGNIQIHLCEDHMHLAFRSKQYKRSIPKIGRNDDCICGSKKKFKKCCGK